MVTDISPLDSLFEGDFNDDASIDVLDYGILLDNFNRDLMDLTPGEAKDLGDLNGDLFVGFDDLVLFRDIYDMVNGTGTFAAIPEPDGNILLAAGIFLSVLGRRFPRFTPEARP